jgi:hypothetical protein
MYKKLIFSNFCVPKTYLSHLSFLKKNCPHCFHMSEKNALFSPVTSSTSSGLLKVKIFSRMREKNINSGSQGSPTKEADDVFLKNRKPATKAEDDNIMSPGSGRTTPKTTIFEKSGMKLKISLPPGISATPAAAPSQSTLSTPTVTITPAVMPSQSLLLDPKGSVTTSSAAQRGKNNSNKLGGYTIR